MSDQHFKGGGGLALQIDENRSGSSHLEFDRVASASGVNTEESAEKIEQNILINRILKESETSSESKGGKDSAIFNFDQASIQKIDPEHMRQQLRKSLKRVKWRWYALTLMSLFICGGYWAYDNPAELQSQIMKDFGVSVTTYSYTYSVYSLPNIIIPLFGGFIVEKIGKGKSLIATAFLVTVGQVLCSIAGFSKSFALLIFGRALYGIGGETMYVIRQCYIAKWFYDQEFSLA